MEGIVNSIINKNNQNKSSYPDSFVDNNLEVKGNDIVDGFNHFFTNIGPHLAANIP